MYFRSLGLGIADMPAGSANSGSLSVEHAVKSERQDEALVSIFQRAALNAAVVTSGINRLAAPQASLSIENFETYLAAVSGTLIVFNSQLLDRDTRTGEFIFAHDFISSATRARRLFRDFAGDATDIGFDRAAILHRNQLAPAWRQVCRLANLVIDEFDREFAAALPDIYALNAQMISVLLTGAQNGLHPCVDRLGQLALPIMPQKRLWPRRAVCQSCSVHYAGKDYPAFVSDISAGGAGLESVPPMQRGMPVALDLESGRVITGSVAWSSAPLAGIAFDKPLAHDDPLLLE